MLYRTGPAGVLESLPATCALVQQGLVKGGCEVGKILIVSAIILAFILLLVFVWPQKPEAKEQEAEPAKGRK